MSLKLEQNCSILLPELDKQICEKLKKTSLLKFNEKAAEKDEHVLKSVVDTNGWDLIYGIQVKYLNMAIRHFYETGEKAMPVDFEIDYRDSDEYQEPIAKITGGKFGAWQIVSGGDGKNICLSVPILEGTFYYNGSSVPEKDGLGGCCVTIEVALEFIEATNNLADSSSNMKLLKIKGHTYQEADNRMPVVVTEFKIPQGCSISKRKRGDLIQGFQEWFNLDSSLKLFDMVFSVVYPDFSIEEDLKWMKKTFTSYAYAENPTSFDNSVFAILAMTNDRDGSNLPHQVPGNMLIDNDRLLSSCLAVNSLFYMKYAFLPSVQKAYPNESTNLVYDDQQNHIEGHNLHLDGVKVMAVTYYPEITDFIMEAASNVYHVDVKLKVDISPGICLNQSYCFDFTLCKGVNDKEETVMSYSVTKTDSKSSLDVDTGIIITEAILGVVGILGSMIAEKMAEWTVQRVIIVIIVAICASVELMIELLVKASISGQLSEKSLPPAKGFVCCGTSDIVWPLCEGDDYERYELNEIVMNGAILFKGDPGYVKLLPVNKL